MSFDVIKRCSLGFVHQGAENGHALGHALWPALLSDKAWYSEQ